MDMSGQGTNGDTGSGKTFVPMRRTARLLQERDGARGRTGQSLSFSLFRAATVLFGSAERLEFEMPQCLLRVARFRGINRSNFLDNRQDTILALLDGAEDGLALREIVAGLASVASERQIKRALAGLRDRGLVKSTGRGAGARWRRIRSGEDE